MLYLIFHLIFFKCTVRIPQKCFPTEILQFLNWTKQLSWNVFSISHVDSLTRYVKQTSVDSQLVNVLNMCQNTCGYNKRRSAAARHFVTIWMFHLNP